MSDDQNPQQDDNTSGHDRARGTGDRAGAEHAAADLPAPATPAPVPAASSKLPPASSIPLTPVVGGGRALRPDGGGENVAQKPWFWLLVALVALLVGAIFFTQCTGSDGESSTTSGDTSDSSSSTMSDDTSDTANADSTTTTSTSTTTVPVASTAPPATTAPPSGSVPGTAPTGNITPQELTGLQAQCIYGADTAACATLTAAGYTATNNYGLGDSLKGSDDATLSTHCTSGIDQLACLELASRHPSSPNDQSTAEEFANAVVAGDKATVETLAAPYVIQQVPVLTAGPYTAGPDIPGTKFNAGKFSFKVQATGTVVCWVSNDEIVFCLVNPNS